MLGFEALKVAGFEGCEISRKFFDLGGLGGKLVGGGSFEFGIIGVQIMNCCGCGVQIFDSSKFDICISRFQIGTPNSSDVCRYFLDISLDPGNGVACLDSRLHTLFESQNLICRYFINRISVNASIQIFHSFYNACRLFQSGLDLIERFPCIRNIACVFIWIARIFYNFCNPLRVTYSGLAVNQRDCVA